MFYVILAPLWRCPIVGVFIWTPSRCPIAKSVPTSNQWSCCKIAIMFYCKIVNYFCPVVVFSTQDMKLNWHSYTYEAKHTGILQHENMLNTQQPTAIQIAMLENKSTFTSARVWRSINGGLKNEMYGHYFHWTIELYSYAQLKTYMCYQQYDNSVMSSKERRYGVDMVMIRDEKWSLLRRRQPMKPLWNRIV